MERHTLGRNLLFLTLLGVSGLLSACMPKIEEEEVVPTVTVESHSLDAINSIDQKITLVGKCPVSTYLLRIMVDSSEYSAGESASVAVASGIPVGTCSSGVLTIVYPVVDPARARAITFKVKAKLNDGRSSADWATRLVNYSPLSFGSPGFAVLALGGITSAAGITMHTAGGEPAGGVGNQVDAPANVLSSGVSMLRTGLHGVLLE